MSNVHIMRGLQRGFQVLEALNARNGSTVSEVCRATSLPRTTTFRVLENICKAGYAHRDPADERYRLTIDARRLSAGFEEEAWVVQVAQPQLAEMTKDWLWPIYVATLYGTSMIIRATTTNRSPLAIDSLSPGTRVPLMTSASGKAYLAHCSDVERETLLNLMERSDDPDHRFARNRTSLEKELLDISNAGCAFDLQAKMRRNPGKTSSFGVPIMVAGQVRGSLVMRYTDAAMKPEKVQERYLKKLQVFAARIADGLSELEADG